MTLPVDLVVLVTGMVPRKNAGLTDLLKLPLGTDGFYNEIHPKLRPVETVVDGVMIAGACQGPKTAPESVASGLAAVAQSAALLKKGFAELDPLVATVHEAACTGCDACLASCPYDAITTYVCDEGHKAVIAAAVCKGCGGCVAVLPGGRHRPPRLYRRPDEGRHRRPRPGTCEGACGMSTLLRQPISPAAPPVDP